MDNDDEAFMKALHEENADSPIRNDFGVFFGTPPLTPTSANDVGDFLGPTPSSSNASRGTSSNAFPVTSSNDFPVTSSNAYGAFLGNSSNVVALSAAKQEVFKYCIGTNNFGTIHNVAPLHHKTLTENDLNTNNLRFESRDWEKAQLANTIRTIKDVHVVDPLGIWRTVKWETIYGTDEKGKLQYCCEMKEWKTFAEGNALETGDKIYMYQFRNTTYDLFALGYVKKQVEMPLPNMPTSNPQNPYVDPSHVQQQQQYNSPFPHATLSNQQARLPQITVPRASAIESNFHTAGSSSAGPSNPLPLVDHNRTSTDYTLVGNQQQNTAPHAVPRVAALPEIQLMFEKQFTHDDLSNLNFHGPNAFLSAAIRPGRISNYIYIQELGDYLWWRVKLSIIPNDGYEVSWSRFIEDKGIQAGDKVKFYKLGGDDANEYEFVLAIEKQQQQQQQQNPIFVLIE